MKRPLEVHQSIQIYSYKMNISHERIEAPTLPFYLGAELLFRAQRQILHRIQPPKMSPVCALEAQNCFGCTSRAFINKYY